MGIDQVYLICQKTFKIQCTTMADIVLILKAPVSNNMAKRHYLHLTVAAPSRQQIIYQMRTLLLVLVLLACVHSEPYKPDPPRPTDPSQRPGPPGNYFAGRFSYTPKRMNQSASFKQVPQATLLLSVSDLAYDGYFGMKLQRELYSTPPNIMTLWINATVFPVVKTAVTNLAVSYMVTVPLTNIQVFYANLTSRQPEPFFKSRYTYTDSLRYSTMVLGFSDNRLSDAVRILSPKIVGEPQNYTVHSIENLGPKDWVEIMLVVVYYGSPGCLGGSLEFKQLLQSLPGRPMTKDVAVYRTNLFYLTGLTVLTFDTTNFSYVEPTMTATNKTYVLYSSVGINVTCTILKIANTTVATTTTGSNATVQVKGLQLNDSQKMKAWSGRVQINLMLVSSLAIGMVLVAEAGDQNRRRTGVTF